MIQPTRPIGGLDRFPSLKRRKNPRGLNALIASLLLLCLIATSSPAQQVSPPPVLQILNRLHADDYELVANSVSSDGKVVVGVWRSFSGQGAFRWSESTGMDDLGGSMLNPETTLLAGEAFAVSGDGSVIVGTGSIFGQLDPGPPLGSQPFRWTVATGVEGLGNLLGYTDPFGSGPYGGAAGVSADGSIVVGRSSSGAGEPNGMAEAFRWTAAGMQGLGDLPGGSFASEAYGISADGTVIIGWGTSAVGREAFRWEAGTMQGLGFLPVAQPESVAFAVSADGSTIVGVNYSALTGAEAVRWTSNGIAALGFLPSGYSSTAYAVSADGSVIVGEGSDSETLTTQTKQAVVWFQGQGPRSLKDILENDYGLDLMGAVPNLAGGVSADGRTIVGSIEMTPGTYDYRAFVCYLGNTRQGTAVTSVLDGGTAVPGGASIVFADVAVGGESAVTSSATGPTPPAGFQLGDPPTFYDVTTSATYAGMIGICFNYSNTSYGDENALRLFHYENGAWMDVTSSVDTVQDIICGTVTSLSPFVVAEPADTDSDGLLDIDEGIYGTDPEDPDTDGDGLLDGTEAAMAVSGCPSPLLADSDGDGLLDGTEVVASTMPCNTDSDEDGVGDATDPLPTDPGVTSGWLEEVVRETATVEIPALDLYVFVAPNANAAAGRRNALANRAACAANAIGGGEYTTAISELQSLHDKIDGMTPPPDWMLDSPEKTLLASRVQLLIALLELL